MKAVELRSCDRETGDGENSVLNVSNDLGHVQSAGTPHILPRTDLDSFRPIESHRMTHIVFFSKAMVCLSCKTVLLMQNIVGEIVRDLAGLFIIVFKLSLQE